MENFAHGRIIFLVDFDSFYASVEENRHPELKGRPIAVCMFSGRTQDSGAIATANYRAREIGIHAGMYIAEAKRLAEKAKKDGKGETAFLPADREHYRGVSDRVMTMLRGEADAFQQVSIDEAYMDMSAKSGGSYGKAERLAMRIKDAIKGQENLTVSIGIGPTKGVAKMAASAKKPDGLTIVRPGEVKAFMGPLPVRKLHGVGPKTAEMLEAAGVKTVGELATYDLGKLTGMVGAKRAETLRKRARGEDDDAVEEEKRKQIGRIITLKKDSRDPKYITGRIPELVEDIMEKLSLAGSLFRTVSVTVVTTHMETKTKSETLDRPSRNREAITSAAERLLGAYLEENPKDYIRRFGVRVSNLDCHDGKPKPKGISSFISKADSLPFP